MARNNSLGCSAETRECDGGAGWGPGMGGTGGPPSGGGGPGTGGAGTAGTSGTGSGRRPGTGCDPRSTDFRDVANWRDARHAVIVFKECGASGGSARILTRAPETADEEWRLVGVACQQPDSDGEDIYSFPTTLACYNVAWAE
jgi:hypothetical protein